MILSTSLRYKVSRLFCKTIIQTAEKVFKAFTTCKLPEFDKELKNNFNTIKQEFVDFYNHNTIPSAGEVSAEQLRIENEHKWKTLVLKVFGYYNKTNCNKCPATYNILKDYDNVVSALFSVMEPGTHIKPHRGVFNGVVRYHLGVIIPKSDKVYINIDKQKRFWKENKSFVFDDTLLHEAINNSQEKRVIMIIDFLRPLPAPLAIVNKAILKIISKSPLIQNIIENLENLKSTK